MTEPREFARVTSCPACQLNGKAANGCITGVENGPGGKPVGRYVCEEQHVFQRRVFIP